MAAIDNKWEMNIPTSIYLTKVSAWDHGSTANTFRAPLSVLQIGGRLIRWLRDNDVRAVICHGHRHISYLRTIEYAHHTGFRCS